MGMAAARPVRGVIFDLDGILADTEHLWEESWQRYFQQVGADWTQPLTRQMQGMSSPEWGRFLADHLGRPESAAEITRWCVEHVDREIQVGRGPLLEGARALVEDVAARVPIGVASSAAREVIDTVLTSNELDGYFKATVSSEEVPRGKPAPDVYLEAAQRVGFAATDGIGIEDSSNGLRAAHAAGLYVVAIPNPQFYPVADALALADFVATDHDDARRHILHRIDGGSSNEAAVPDH